MLQVLVLKSAGYSGCVSIDIGKLIIDDGVIVGVLSSYDNTTRTWHINSPSTIGINSVITIQAGTGAGTANADSAAYSDYADINDVKDRMLILTTDTSYDDSINLAITEASRLVDVFLKPYTTVPLTTYDDNISALTADFAASIFKRRTTPQETKIRGTLQPDMLNDIDGTGWFALGLRKIEQYIKSYYILSEVVGNTAHNPDIFTKLFKDGIITGKEARAFINAATEVANTIIDTITKTLNLTETDIITKTLIDTQTLTKTRELTDTIVEDITRTLGETLTKEQTDTIIQTISKTISDIITQTKDITSVEDLTKTLVDTLTQNITKVLGETITRETTDTLIKSIDETLTKNQEDVEDLVRTENITSTKVLSDTQTITKTIEEDITINKTTVDGLTRKDDITHAEENTIQDTKSLTETVKSGKILSEEATKTLNQKDSVNKTLTESVDLADKKRLDHARKQKSFAFVSSDKNGGYKKDAEVD
jgi:hypothetical protein